MKSICLYVILLLVSGQAIADCYLDGRPYRTGESVEGKRCGADGYWYPE